ncbi:hypothetical protein KCP69_23855 [Salmonella enterica subsp. enterica]|nr:hypothetical protein KCP69_23855 [Salmonella enterica subsp. enterica]
MPDGAALIELCIAERRPDKVLAPPSGNKILDSLTTTVANFRWLKLAIYRTAHKTRRKHSASRYSTFLRRSNHVRFCLQNLANLFNVSVGIK